MTRLLPTFRKLFGSNGSNPSAVSAAWGSYQTWTDRRIPVVVCEPA
ncbi:nitroreductase/quinone reductase family protein [Nocardia wallacei]